MKNWRELQRSIDEESERQERARQAGRGFLPVKPPRKKRGRPRKDKERKQIQSLRARGWSWQKIANHMNQLNGVTKNKEAYRKLATRK